MKTFVWISRLLDAAQPVPDEIAAWAAEELRITIRRAFRDQLITAYQMELLMAKAAEVFHDR